MFFHAAGYLKSDPTPKVSSWSFLPVVGVVLVVVVIVVLGALVVLNQKVGTTLVVVVVVVAFVLLLFSLDKGFIGFTNTCCCCCCKATMFRSCIRGP